MSGVRSLSALAVIFSSVSATRIPDGGAPQNALLQESGAPQDALLQGKQTSTSEVAMLKAEVDALKKTVLDLQGQIQESKVEFDVKDGSRKPTRMTDPTAGAQPLNLADRLRYLERKVDGSVNWLEDPQLWRRQQYQCKNMTDLNTNGEHHVCLDNWEKRQHKDSKDGCIVYDLGVRADPDFGANLLQTYGCSIRAYDPSDISARWWKGDEKGTITSQSLRDAGEGRYKFTPMAAGGVDGPVSLFEFNWNQVSIVHGEIDLTREDPETRKPQQREFQVTAKTLPTMMKDHGDKKIDILKVDIEGSEYAFMQQAFDTMGCPPVGQMTLEFHNFDLDERYGSSAEINTIHNMLNACGFKSFMVRDHWRNDVTDTNAKWFLPPKRFTLASYCKDCL
eukprot:TRINITY_DN10218_c0_g2_i2.p1 TRINITY_DN10218_c0_g2~~TRINITY_DN10218_c0_g2_i2.p1  ORF type:complete len:393 (+),score=121.27 TRINITY_DN10218_c0_g2_i2:65-1243(+)